MPGGIRKRGSKFSVMWGGRRTAKATTRGKAQRQLNLLRGLKHGWKPTRKR